MVVMAKYKSMQIKMETWQLLTVLKAELEAKSYDEVIMYLLEPYINQLKERRMRGL